jgi:hypothetical protein
MGPKTVSTLNVNNSWGKTCNLSGALSITDGGTIASGTFSNEVDVSGPGGHIVNATLSPGGLKVQNGGTVVVDTGGFSASALNVQAGGTLKMDSSLATVTITGAGFTNAGTVYGGYNGRVAWGGVGAGPPRG